MNIPEFLLSDLLATVAFGVVAILLIVLGYITFDKLTPKLDFSDLLNKGNMALAVVVGSFILGLCYVIGRVVAAILGSSVSMALDDKGLTLWEMLTARLHAGGNGAGIAFWNPLDLRVGSPMPIAYANGPEFADYSFTVQELREYTRTINAQQFQFTDYVLSGVNTKSFDASQTVTARLRTVPNQAGAHDSLLLRTYDEFAFAEGFIEVLKDESGIFEVTDDKTGAKEVFTRINNLRESYQPVVLVVSATTPDGKAANGKATPMKLEYWDYWREVDLGGGNKAKEFLFVEMNSDTGWFQLWRGREYFTP